MHNTFALARNMLWMCKISKISWSLCSPAIIVLKVAPMCFVFRMCVKRPAALHIKPHTSPTGTPAAV